MSDITKSNTTVSGITQYTIHDGKERVDDIHIESSAVDRSLSAGTRNRNNNSDGHIVFSEITERSE